MNEGLGPFNLVLLALPGVALLVVARTMYRRAVPRQRSEMQQLLRLAGILLIVLAVLGMVVGVVGWFALVGVPLAAVVLLMVVNRYRRGEHQSLLYMLAASATRGVPLPAAARAFAEENSGDTSTRALALAENLEQGARLKDAACWARLKLSTASRLAMNVGESINDLGQVLHQGLENQLRVDLSLQAAATRMVYVLVLPIVGLNILTFVMLKIVPIFQRMFEEFGIKLPAMTVLLIHMSKSMTSGPTLFVTYPLIALCIIALNLTLLLFVLHLLGWMPRDIPPINTLLRRYDGALVMMGLATCIERRMPLYQALVLLYREFPRASTARRAGVAAFDVGLGRDWCEALRYQRLLTPADEAVLKAAERAGNLPWALREMADRSIRRQVDRLQSLSHALLPIFVIGFGICVAYLVVGLFMPLVSLIQGLS
jgi:type II secretory pathway component PulF